MKGRPPMPRKLLLAITPLVFLAACKPAGEPSTKAIIGAVLIDGNGGPPIADSVVVVAGTQIRAAGPRAGVPIPAGSEKIDASGKYLAPGLMDLHVHLGSRAGPGFVAADYTREQVEKNLNAYLYFGVTTVRSVGTEREAGFQVRKAQRDGAALGARLFTAGRGFTARGGHPAQEVGEIARQTDDPAEARKQVAELASQQVDLVKIWIDDLHGKQPKVRNDVIEAILDEARKFGIPVVAHIYSLAETEHFFRHGGAGFVHMIRDTEDIPGALIDQLRDRKVVFTPTLVRQELGWLYAEKPRLLDDPDAARTAGADIVAAVRQATAGQKASAPSRTEFDRAVRNSRKLASAGVLIAVGSDGGSSIDFPGLMTHREIEILREAGFSPGEALTAATRNGAIGLGKLDELGTIEHGKRADLLLLDADPLEDVRNLRRISRIMKDGQWINR